MDFFIKQMGMRLTTFTLGSKWKYSLKWSTFTQKVPVYSRFEGAQIVRFRKTDDGKVFHSSAVCIQRLDAYGFFRLVDIPPYSDDVSSYVGLSGNKCNSVVINSVAHSPKYILQNIDKPAILCQCFRLCSHSANNLLQPISFLERCSIFPKASS